MSKKLVIVGGHGKVSQLLTKAVSKRYEVHSIIRAAEQSDQIKGLGAKPVVLSLEDSSVADFTKVLEGSSHVVWSAGAGGRGGPQRTIAVDKEAAIKVFDAIEQLPGKKPRLVVVSAIDVRDTGKPVPSHYTDEDKQRSAKIRESQGMKHYYEQKLAADRDLSKRSAFNWTILKPGTLLDEPGAGKVSLGQTRMQPGVTREDVATVLAALLERDDANGMAFDLVGGDVPVAEAVNQAISSGKSDLYV